MNKVKWERSDHYFYDCDHLQTFVPAKTIGKLSLAELVRFFDHVLIFWWRGVSGLWLWGHSHGVLWSVCVCQIIPSSHRWRHVGWSWMVMSSNWEGWYDGHVKFIYKLLDNVQCHDSDQDACHQEWNFEEILSSLTEWWEEVED